MRSIVKNRRGQMMPFLAIMIIILLLFASFSIATTMTFLERKKVEDALDAAVLSALTSDVEERYEPTYYYDYLDPITETVENKDGTTKTYVVGYDVRQNDTYYKNLIYLKSSFRSTISNYFARNLKANSVEAELISIVPQVEYDDERFLLVKKRFYYMNPPSEIGGVPVYGCSTNPPPWWLYAFGGTEGFTEGPEPFNGDPSQNEISYEERIVRFPRWVKITATATVKVPSLLGKLLGSSNTATIRVQVSGVRELLQVDRPQWSLPRK